jgi:hypothetical protein
MNPLTLISAFESRIQVSAAIRAAIRKRERERVKKERHSTMPMNPDSCIRVPNSGICGDSGSNPEAGTGTGGEREAQQAGPPQQPLADTGGGAL